MAGLPDDFEPLETATVTVLAGALAHGRTTSRALTTAYLERIDALDTAFGAVRLAAPDAVAQAEASDEWRAEHGPRGILEGIPVLVNDNIDVAGLPTTAGALALEGSTPERDASIVARLREAGAVILGKTNVTELANFMTAGMPPGYSSLGGQVLNPYDIALTPGGASSGSAVAVALGLAPVSVGTGTDGSITAPAEHQSLVGFKPTVGLVSRTGIMPVAPTLDSAGTLTRSVAAAARLLAVLAGSDPLDPATGPAGGKADQVAAELAEVYPDSDALADVRLAVVRGPEEVDDWGRAYEVEGREAVYATALDALAATGADLFDVTLPEVDWTDDVYVMHYEFEPSMDRYLAGLGSGATRTSLAEIQAWNHEHADVALKYLQTHVDAAMEIDHEAPDSERNYHEARARDVAAVSAALDVALSQGAEAVVFPGSSGRRWAARLGWPSVVLPAGYGPKTRRPVGLIMVSPAWTDARLLAMAFAAEQALTRRQPPSAVNPAAFRRFGDQDD